MCSCVYVFYEYIYSFIKINWPYQFLKESTWLYYVYGCFVYFMSIVVLPACISMYQMHDACRGKKSGIDPHRTGDTVIPALRRQRQVDFWVWGQPSLQNEFQDSQDSIEEPCLKKQKTKNKQKELQLHMTVCSVGVGDSNSRTWKNSQCSETLATEPLVPWHAISMLLIATNFYTVSLPPLRKKSKITHTHTHTHTLVVELLENRK